jgi:hypothetical protein
MFSAVHNLVGPRKERTVKAEQEREGELEKKKTQEESESQTSSENARENARGKEHLCKSKE